MRQKFYYVDLPLISTWTEAHNLFQILKSAQDLEIFDVLEEGGPLSAENLAQKKGYHAKSTERLLNTLTSMKLATQESRKSGQ